METSRLASSLSSYSMTDFTQTTPRTVSTSQNLNRFANGVAPDSSSSGRPLATTLTVQDLLAAHDGSAASALKQLLSDHNHLLHTHQQTETDRARMAAENTKVWSYCSELKRERQVAMKDVERHQRIRKRLEQRVQDLQNVCKSHGVSIPTEASTSEEEELTSNLTPRDKDRRPSATRSNSAQSDKQHSTSSSSSRIRQISNQSASSTSTHLSQSLPHSSSQTRLRDGETSSNASPIVSASSSSNHLERSKTPDATVSASEKTPVLRRKASSVDLGKISEGHPLTLVLAQADLSRAGQVLSTMAEVSPSGENGPIFNDSEPKFAHASSPTNQFGATPLPQILNSPFAPLFPNSANSSNGSEASRRPAQSSDPAIRAPSSQSLKAPSSELSQHALNALTASPGSSSGLPSPASVNSSNAQFPSKPSPEIAERDGLTTPTTEIESFLPEFSTPQSQLERGYPPSPEIHFSPAKDHITRIHSEEDDLTGRRRASSAPLVPSPHLPALDGANPLSASTSQSNEDSATSRMTRPVRLVPALLPFLQVTVLNSHIRTNDRSREIISFTIQLFLKVPDQRIEQCWTIEKRFSDILTMDADIKARHSRSQNRKLASLPDKSLFKDHAPNKVDLRKQMLQKYLQTVVSVPLQDASGICIFMQSNVVHERNARTINPAYKAGFLTKKGRLIGGWQTRYYVLQGPYLQYYDSQGGSHLGQIDVTGAQIGRQQSQSQATASGDSYRHAFLIRESRKGTNKSDEVDHILCAESDRERDEWVKVLAAWYTGEYVSPPEEAAQSSVAERPRLRQIDSNSFEQPRQPDTLSQSTPSQQLAHAPQIRKTGRKLSKDDIARGPAQPLASLPSDGRNVKFFGNADGNQKTTGHHRRDESSGKASNATDDITSSRLPSKRRKDLTDHAHLSSSLPANLDSLANNHSSLDIQRPGSEQEQYSDQDTKDSTSQNGGNLRPDSPDKRLNAKISGPINGAPIGNTGFNRIRPVEERRARVKSSFWNFAARTDKHLAPILAQARPVFGVPLEEAVAVARVREGFDLPAIVFRCIEYLEAKSAEMEEGLYRLSGSANTIKALKDRFNIEGDVNLLAGEDYMDPHAVAGLLKLFLRELPVHVLTPELQPAFLQVCDLANRRDKVNELGALVAQLPVANYTLMRFLTAHLIHIVENEKVNRMNLRNVGIVFSPTLKLPATLFSLFLTEFGHVFRILDDQPAPLKIEEDEDLGDAIQRAPLAVEIDKMDRRRSRNSVYYSSAGASALLEHHQTASPALREAEEDEDDEASESDSEADAADAQQIAQPAYSVHENRPSALSTKAKDLRVDVQSAGAIPSYSSPTNLLKIDSPNLPLRSPGLPASPRVMAHG